MPGLSSETMADNQSQDVTNECTFHTSNTKNIHFATAAAEAVWQNNSNEELGMEKEFDFLDDEKSVESQRTDVRDHSKDIIHNSREVPESVSEDGENISLASEDNDALVSEWNIVKYLPQTAAHYFRQIVGTTHLFIYL